MKRTVALVSTLTLFAAAVAMQAQTSDWPAISTAGVRFVTLPTLHSKYATVFVSCENAIPDRVAVVPIASVTAPVVATGRKSYFKINSDAANCTPLMNNARFWFGDKSGEKLFATESKFQYANKSL